MRLIDADALLISMEKRCDFEMNHMRVIKRMMKLVKTEPTIETVKHGHWKMYGTAYQCSVCKEGDAFGLTPYCRWCGAKMDEEVGKDAN